MSQIVGFEDIVGLADSGQYGPSEVAGARTQAAPGVWLAKELPKSYVGVPVSGIAVVGGGVADVHLDVQREFRPDRLMLLNLYGTADSTAERDACQLLTFSIGDTNLNASPNPVPALAVFAPAAVGTSIRAPRTTDPSLGIDMQLVNANAAGEGSPSWGFGGMVVGPSARPGAGPRGGVAGIVGSADSENDPSAQSAADAKDLPQSFVGIPYTAAPVNAGQRVTIQCQIYRDIRPDRMVTGEATYESWMVRDVRVGTTSLNASTNPAPAACFAMLAFGSRLRATVTATPSVGITVDAYSLNSGATTDGPFCGAFFGPSRFPST